MCARRSEELLASAEGWGHAQRAQYPLIKAYGLNYIGLHIMI